MAVLEILPSRHNARDFQDSNVSFTGTSNSSMSGEDFSDDNSTSVFTTPTYTLVWVTVANLLVLLVGVMGNTLVIVVVSCVRDMRTPTNLCLMNLSLADLLVLIICQPSALLEFYAQEKWMLGTFMCKLTVFLENMVCLASILIILSISFERYYAVCYPLKMYSTESRSKALVLMGVMWTTAAALTSPFLAMARTRSTLHFVDLVNVTVCETPIERNGWPYAYVIVLFFVVFIVPLCLLIFLYSRIIFKVAVDTMDSRQMTDIARAQLQRSRQQLVIMLVGVVILFFVCLLPFRIVVLYNITRTDPDTMTQPPMDVMHFVRLLIYVNSAGNPIIYSLVSTKFRRAFARVLHRLGCHWTFIRTNIHSEENGTLRRNTVTHYTSVRQEHTESPTDAV